MSTKINPREVLTYLNYLGYQNINPQQLKEFIHDLKKLIKYEERKKSSGNLQKDEESESSENCDYIPSVRAHKKRKDVEEPQPDIFSVLHSQGTCSSNAKIVPKKESVILLKFKRGRLYEYPQQNEKTTLLLEPSSSKECDKTTVPSQDNNYLNDLPVKDNPTDNLNKADHKLPQKKSCSNKSKSSFIRTQVPINNKSDPVALYHQYQAMWKKQKFPGEDSRSELRWAIREKMLSGPRVTRA